MFEPFKQGFLEMVQDIAQYTMKIHVLTDLYCMCSYRGHTTDMLEMYEI